MRNVLLHTPKYPPRYAGGASTYFSGITHSLSSKYHFSVLTYYCDDAQIVEEREGIRIYRVFPRLDMVPYPYRPKIESIFSFIASLFIFFHDDVKLIHTHSTMYPTHGVVAASELLRIPIVFDCQDEQFSTRLVRRGHNTYWLSGSQVVDNILEQAGVPMKKTDRIPLAIPPHFESLAQPMNYDSKFTVIFIGRLVEFKGVHLVLEAFIRSDLPDAKLVIVGDGPLLKDIESRIEQCEQKGKVELIGEVPHKEALELIEVADVLVHPSSRDVGPRVVDEALRLQTPVVATSVGKIPNMVQNGENGFIIERELREIQTKITYLYKNPSVSDEMANTEHTDDYLEWGEVVERIDDIYRDRFP